MSKLLAYQMFLKKANSDLKASIKLMDDDEIESEIICFHLQQSVEKYLKAYLIFNGNQPKKIHDIGLLIHECKKIDEEFIIFDDSIILELTDCGVIARYDELEEIDKEFIKSSLTAVLELKLFIENKLSKTIFENN
ncbi:MAG: HEPN domain-containing protein [Candidatus Kapabacteria bacterium]|nr:HEPN domain-containing protein [Candidatus Kapabacteria bacterium]